jgi:hypothetical protein
MSPVTPCFTVRDTSGFHGNETKESPVFEAADIQEWRGHTVVDPDGSKIGELETIYVDTSTDEPSFATIEP